MKKVLVTGADGFIGSHLCELLVEQGYSVRAFVLYNSFNAWGWLDHVDQAIREEIEIFSGDIRDPFGVRRAVQGCDRILHLAALIAIPYSYHSPVTYVETNVLGTLNVVQAARDCEVDKVVHTSTSEVYGTARFVPITEDHPLQGQSPYSASKIGADQIALSYHLSFGLPLAVIRPFNTYGPRQSARAIIPTVITQLMNGATTLRLGALHPTRDFTFVRDTAMGFIRIMECEESVGEVINVGSGFEISMGEVVEEIAGLMDRRVEIQTEEERLRPEKSEVERLWADTAKMKRLTGWEPEYAGRDGFRKGLARTIDWFSDPENLRGYKGDLYNI